MIGNNKDRSSREDVDLLGVELIRAAALTERDAEEAVSSPFLFSRVRAEIEARKGFSIKAPKKKWPIHFAGDLLLGAVRLSIAAGLVVGATVFWTVWARSVGQTQPQSAPRRVAGITACSLSDADKCIISTTEVVQLVVSGNGGGNMKELAK